MDVLKELVLYDDLPTSTKRPVVREDYNELVFFEPSEYMYNILESKNATNSSNSNNQEEIKEAQNQNNNSNDVTK
eukprot:CAMPEP_0116884264 /NCGR_PEP_ID=MMETSP0463-20121206/17095_1 /TAXON_ID=181622 /ORGANISM="Strombidinopsis sp, Strain SopsisLIS2011" /LENGTH=74 /DNA_ID=CAMNT_0004540473 /DNA_START=320 /DNA_END=544 /DNA_ORIENTATION=-